MPAFKSPAKLQRRAEEYFRHLQDELCATIVNTDGKARFQGDLWSHPSNGGGRTMIMQNGGVFEKVGVNFSAITAMLSEQMATRLTVQAQNIFATGISLVIHPSSPMIPTTHMNLRYLELENGDAWFGGGADLTPYYIVEDDVRHFHQSLKSVCDIHDQTFYPRFKRQCDEYFFLKHRSEARGIGGIFFDYQRESLDKIFALVQDIGAEFLRAYIPIVERRKNDAWGEQEKEWQCLRRGRYVEFNLLYDRGTLFGLETGGRTESILMSLPPEVRWTYNHHPPIGSREASLVALLQQPRDWV